MKKQSKKKEKGKLSTRIGKNVCRIFFGFFLMISIPATIIAPPEGIPLLLWSREAPPCHITMVGSHHPLREPDLHLSMYPALLSFGQQLLTGCGLQHGIFCTQPAFYAVLQSLQPPMPACP